LVPGAPAGSSQRGPRRDPATHLPYPQDVHELHRHLRLIAHLGVPTAGACAALQWPLTDADHQAAAQLHAAYGLRPGRYVVIDPGATSPSRRWPTARYAQVADALGAPGLRVVIGGVADERGVTGEVVAATHTPVVDLTGRTTLGEYAVLLRDAALLVGNDTGSAHLAIAVGGRAVTVFQSGDPRRWAYPASQQTVVRADVGCNPCPHLSCPIDFRCAEQVRVSEVLAAAARWL
jgi:ADP-heptose:LPS heptosyltransferase